MVTTRQGARPSSKRAANTTKPDSAVKKSTRRSPKTKDEITDSAFPPPQRQQLSNGYFGFIGPARTPPTGPTRSLKRSKKDTVELGSRSIKQFFNAIPPTIIISDFEEDVDSSSSAAFATPTLNRLTDIRTFTTLVWEAGLQQIFKCPSKHDNVIQLANDKDFVPSFEYGHPNPLGLFTGSLGRCCNSYLLDSRRKDPPMRHTTLKERAVLAGNTMEGTRINGGGGDLTSLGLGGDGVSMTWDEEIIWHGDKMKRQIHIPAKSSDMIEETRQIRGDSRDFR
ncbi:hypothetical protein B0T13DRAFT_523111 [Neurospora crassa]|nr:hypothetical protein B0T13DRAFT_523111 [Neurospora crassa]